MYSPGGSPSRPVAAAAAAAVVVVVVVVVVGRDRWRQGHHRVPSGVARAQAESTG